MNAPSKAQAMTPRQQAAFLSRFRRMWETRECEHGHYGCSTKRGGACLNEVLAEVETRSADARAERRQARMWGAE